MYNYIYICAYTAHGVDSIFKTLYTLQLGRQSKKYTFLVAWLVGTIAKISAVSWANEMICPETCTYATFKLGLGKFNIFRAKNHPTKKQHLSNMPVFFGGDSMWLLFKHVPWHQPQAWIFRGLVADLGVCEGETKHSGHITWGDWTVPIPGEPGWNLRVLSD